MIQKISKEEKLKRKKRVKAIQKIDKRNKKLLVIFSSILLFKLITILLMYFFKGFASFYLTNILNPINGIFYSLFSLIPYFSFIFLILYFILCFVAGFLILKISNDSKEKIKVLNYKYNKVNRYMYIIIFLLLMFLVTDMQKSHLPIMDDIQFKETKDKTYTVDDVDTLINYYADKINYYSERMNRDKDGNIIYKNEYTKQVVSDLKNSKDKLALLNGLYPLRSDNINDLFLYLYGSDLSGITQMYNTYFSYDSSPTEILNVITHEYCHTKGYMRENETVMCSYIAGINSKDEISQYAAYLEGYNRSLYAYSYLDLEKSDIIDDKISSKCLLNNYSEICGTKQSKEYVLGAYNIYIYTYKLFNYVDYKEELIESLEILSKNGFKLKLNRDGKEITIEEVKKLIDSKSEDSIYIIEKFNNEKFDKIKEAFKNDKLYSYIYQENYKYEEAEEEKNNPTEYFLSPFPKDYDRLYNSADYLAIDYTYERALRLFLEYHDKYGY